MHAARRAYGDLLRPNEIHTVGRLGAVTVCIRGDREMVVVLRGRG